MTLNRKVIALQQLVLLFLRSSSIKIFSKLIRIKISNKLQLLQPGGIPRDRRAVLAINN